MLIEVLPLMRLAAIRKPSTISVKGKLLSFLKSNFG